MSDLRSQINNLSPAEKAELLDTVWESLEADAVSLTDGQRAELDYRIARHEAKPFRWHPMAASQGGPVQEIVTRYDPPQPAQVVQRGTRSTNP
jgi:putative addiction module component (TIGR02574 family)